VAAPHGEAAGLSGALAMCLAWLTASLSVVARTPRDVAKARGQLHEPRGKVADASHRLSNRIGQLTDRASQVAEW
jgi:hypothetical protein